MQAERASAARPEYWKLPEKQAAAGRKRADELLEEYWSGTKASKPKMLAVPKIPAKSTPGI